MTPIAPSSINDFCISSDAISYVLNLRGNTDDVSISVYTGAKIVVFHQGIIGYDAARNYRQWTVTAFPTHFDDHSARYVHISLSRSGSSAMVVFPSTRLDLLGRPITDDGSAFVYDIDEDGNELDPAEDEGHYYVYLGKLSSSGEDGNTERRWLHGPDTGILDTDQFRNEQGDSELARMFRLDSLKEHILQLLPFRSIFIGRNKNEQKEITDIQRSSDDLQPSDTIIPTTAFTDREYLSKTKKEQQSVAGPVTFDGDARFNRNVSISTSSAIKSDNFSAMSGLGIYCDESGMWHIATDIVDVRVKLTAKEIEVQKVTSIGGALMLSAANGIVDHVGTLHEKLMDGGDIYSPILYFRTTDDSGRIVSVSWKKYDILYCETFNLVKDDDGFVGTRLYKYVVRSVITNPLVEGGEEGFVGVVLYTGANNGPLLAPWVENTVSPKAGDNVVQLGNTRELDRQRAIILAGAGSGSPYIYMWKGIDGYALGKPMIKLDEEPEMTLKSLNIIVNGGDRNIAEALSDSMNIYTLGDEETEVLAPVDNQGNAIDQTLGVTGWPDVVEAWADYDGHVGDYAVTTDSYYYRFEYNGTSYYWHLVTDEHLIAALDAAADAKRSADKALKSLQDMASDGVITAQEKQVLARDFNDIKNEFRAINSEALKYKEVEIVTNASKDLRSTYQGVTFFMNLLGLISKPYSTTDTDIAESSFSIPACYYADNGIVPNKPYHFAEMMELYYNCYCNLRRELSSAIYQKIADAALSGGNLDPDTKDKINYLTTNFEQSCNDWFYGSTYNTTMETMTNELAALSAWKKTHDGSVEGSGFVTTSDFALLFSQHISDNGDVTLARAFTSVAWERKADGSYGWQSGFTIDADVVKINSQNFKVNVDGKGTVEIHGTLDVGSNEEGKQRIVIHQNNSSSASLDFLCGGVDCGGFKVSGNDSWYYTEMTLKGILEGVEHSAYFSPDGFGMKYTKNGIYRHAGISDQGLSMDQDCRIDFYGPDRSLSIASNVITSPEYGQRGWGQILNKTIEVFESITLTGDIAKAIVVNSDVTVTLPSGVDVRNGHEVWICNTTGRRVDVKAPDGYEISGGGSWFENDYRWNVYILHNRTWIYGLMNK